MPCSECGQEDQREEKSLRVRHGHALESSSELIDDEEMEISREVSVEGAEKWKSDSRGRLYRERIDGRSLTQSEGSVMAT
jgi:hypothetical protein